VSEVRAEMVATIRLVSVAVGAEVVQGDTLLVLESMKMEIPVLAEAVGTVTSLPAGVGAVVQEGDLLAVLTP
jgi:acetyl-CoA carboxylase biotin carboxyl carrier protein